MMIPSMRRASSFAFTLAAAATLATAPLSAGTSQDLKQAFSKDVGPASAGCDKFEKASAAWAGCVGQARVAMPVQEAFYAGYWLAKAGRYDEAIRYLKGASQQDERVLTYIGFATRKLGDVDAALPYYGRALALNPNYAVARAYLGEAYLTKGEPAKAKGELAEIERRCGKSCAEYADLARNITAFEASAATVIR
jgi:tetratricopeptide (TPR) repeat protein